MKNIYPNKEKSAFTELEEQFFSDRKWIYFRKQMNSTVRFNRRIHLSREGILRCAQNEMAADDQ